MKQILEEYGTFLLEGMVLVSLLGLLFGRITDEAGKSYSQFPQTFPQRVEKCYENKGIYGGEFPG